jgi:sortase (surface protein transpeptidase)
MPHDAALGERDTVFRPLRNIRLCGIIIVKLPAGKCRYRVTSAKVVNPAAKP